MIARLLRLYDGGTPRGTAQLTSTPSRSRRKSQCSAVAWCSWITKIGSSPAGVAAADGSEGTGSGVFPAVRLAM